MKKIFVICLFLTFFLTTGCVKYSCRIDIDNDDNIVMSEVEALDIIKLKSFDEDLPKGVKESMEKTKQDYKKEGYEVESYSDSKYYGLKKIKEYDIDNFENEDLPHGFISENETPIEVKKELFKNIYTILINYDKQAANEKLSEELSEQDSTGDEVLDKMADEFADVVGSGMKSDLDITIKIPVKALEDNAYDVTPQNEYKWILTDKKPIKIYLKYEKYHWQNIIIFLSSCLILGAILAFAIYKKIHSNNW